MKSFDPGPSSVLIVDDEAGMRTALQGNFLRHGWRVDLASGVRDAERAVQAGEFDLVVSDIRMRDGDGFEVMDFVRGHSPSTAVILLTAFGSVPQAVESMRGGAFDYLTKPVSFEKLQTTARRVMERTGPERETQACGTNADRAQALPAEPGRDNLGSRSGIVGRSPELLRALQRANAAASTDADVLVEAESGTGKELLAKLIHESSSRSCKPFVALNCAAVPEHLIESELFGHAKGAFTGASSARAGRFEVAHGGTLLLDEIGEMPLNLQPKLLRVLQEREFERVGEARSIKVDIRVIATTNASLASMVEQGRFRSDLYYRLNVIPLSLPALRERKADIPALAQHFAARFAEAEGDPLPHLDASFLECLQTHSWPGNIRELGNFMRRVLSLHRGATIDASCFESEFRPIGRPAAAPALHSPGARIADIEKIHFENTLALTHGNRTHAAEMLGISLRTMRNKIREYGLPPRSYA